MTATPKLKASIDALFAAARALDALPPDAKLTEHTKRQRVVSRAITQLQADLKTEPWCEEVYAAEAAAQTALANASVKVLHGQNTDKRDGRVS
jgi:hypothetical protein